MKLPCRPSRYLALYNHKAYWVRPQTGSDPKDIPDSTLFLLYQQDDGAYGVVLPLVDAHHKAWLRGDEDSIELVTLADSPAEGASAPTSAATSRPAAETLSCPSAEEPSTFLMVHLTGADPYALIRDAVSEAQRRLGSVQLRWNKPRPANLDTLGWCTWDAFYREVSEEKVLDGLDSFQRLGIPLGYMILDDGAWDTRGDYLTDIAFNQEKFPRGLSPLIREVKSRYGLRSFGIWHCFQGYWDGIDPQGPLNKKYRTMPHTADMRPWDGGRLKDVNPIVPEDIAGFYEELYAFLQKEGVDLVKVDGQCNLENMCTGALPRAKTMDSYQKAMQHSAARHFDSQVIHCMSNSNEVAYRMDKTNLWRNSDDYFPSPDLPAREALSLQQEHLYVNAMNALWSSAFAWPDWDMFQSHSSGAAMHAAARALSGGPVYVCDKPHQQDGDLLRQLMAEDGHLLHTDAPALPSPGCLFTDCRHEKKLLKLFAPAGSAWMLGLFNCFDGQEIVSDRFSLKDVPGADASSTYAVYLRIHRGPASTASPEEKVLVLGATDSVTVALPPDGYAMATMVPIQKGLAMIGAVQKLIPPAAVSPKKAHSEAALQAKILCAGPVLLYAQSRPSEVLVNHQAADWQWADGWLRFTAEAGSLIEIIDSTPRNEEE